MEVNQLPLLLVLENPGHIFPPAPIGDAGFRFPEVEGIGHMGHVLAHPDHGVHQFDVIRIHGPGVRHQEPMEADAPEQVAPGFRFKAGDPVRTRLT